MTLMRIYLSALFFLFSAQAIAADDSDNHRPNGNYRYIEIGLAKTSEATSICSGINSGECYKTLRGTELTASLQFYSLPNLVISASSTGLGAAGTNDNLTSSVSKLSIGLIGGFGPVDILISISDLNADILSCPNGNNVCQVVLNNAADYGLMAKLWVGEAMNFNIGINVDRYAYAPSSVNMATGIFSTWMPAPHHALSARLSSEMDINGTAISTGGALSYAYLF